MLMGKDELRGPTNPVMEVATTYPRRTLYERLGMFKKSLDDLEERQSKSYSLALDSFSMALLCWLAYLSFFPNSKGRGESDRALEEFPKSLTRFRKILDQVPSDSTSQPNAVTKLKSDTVQLEEIIRLMNEKGDDAAMKAIEQKLNSTMKVAG